MPRTPDLHITRAWRFRSEPDRVHYIMTTHDGNNRHLWTLNNTAIGKVLDAALLAKGYTGPLSEADEDESEGLAAEE